MKICVVPDCMNPAKAHRGYCWTHYNKMAKSKTLPPRDEVSSYEYMHAKLRRERGSAKGFKCVDCEERQAEHWSLDHTAPAVSLRTHEHDNRNHGRVFSVDVDDYSPRCAACHAKHDIEHDLLRAPTGNRNPGPRGRYAKRAEEQEREPKLDGYEVRPEE